MIQPPARTESGLTLRPISLGSLEVLRQLGNPLSAGNAELTNIDIGILTEFIWVHTTPLVEVMETVYTPPSQVKRKAAKFAMSISPTELRVITLHCPLTKQPCKPHLPFRSRILRTPQTSIPHAERNRIHEK